jgi:hypothetical protein
VGLLCRCGAHWQPRKLTRRERPTCRRAQGEVCTPAQPCVACLISRARAVSRVGEDFPAIGVLAYASAVANA